MPLTPALRHTLRSLVFSFTAPLAVLVTAPAARAQDSSLVTAHDVREACRFAASGVHPAAPNQRWDDLRAFCGAGLRTLIDSAPTIPSTTTIALAATSRFPVEVKGAGSNPASTLLAALPAQSDVIVGVTQFVVGRAKEEVTEYVVNRFATDLCTRKFDGVAVHGEKSQLTAGAFLPTTCAFLSSAQSKELLGEGFAVPSWSGVQAALRSDAAALPDVVIARFNDYATANYGGLPAAHVVAAQRVVAITGAVRMGATYAARRDVGRAFRDATAAMSRSLVAICKAPAAAPTSAPATQPNGIGSSTGQGASAQASACAFDAAQWTHLRGAEAMLVAGTVAAMLPGDLLSDAMRDAAVRDTVALYTTRAALVNLAGTDNGSRSVAQLALADALNTAGFASAGQRAYRLASLARTTADSIGAIEAQVRQDVAAAQGDQQKILAAYARGASLAATALDGVAHDFPAFDTGEALAETDRLLGMTARVGRYIEYEAEGNYVGLLADLATLASQVEAQNTLNEYALPPRATRFVQFAAAAGQARDADAFESVLDSYAAPRNAFLRKRTYRPGGSHGYWAINAYAGASGGFEWARGDQIPSGAGSRVSTAGLFMPIGLEGGIATSRAGGFGLLLQVIDVGQVASWRFHQQGGSDVKTTPPGLTLASVFAPGGALLWHVPHVPLSLGADAAFAPQFRDLTQSTNAAQPRANVVRTTLFLAVDVPLFP